nr:uncharacterized protein LOC129265193 [Lytechinus pictus]
MTVDDGGYIDVSDGGHLAQQGQGAGISHRLGGSGASHAGLGGRGGCQGYVTCTLPKNLPYGDLYNPRDFGSGGGGARGGIGGGTLQIQVADVLQVDGTIMADSLDLALTSSGSDSSGGSGGSILIESGAFIGGHTGSIQALGGAAKYTNGGSGAGGRIAIYHQTNVTHGEYRGSLRTEGGPVGMGGAGAGAAGTVYIKHLDTGFSVLKVDNGGRKPITKEIENVGTRLNLAGGTRSKSSVYTATSGVRVSSSGPTYDPYPHHHDYYYLAYLFDQSYNGDARSYYRSSYHSVVLTFDLGEIFFLNVIRVHVQCTALTKFRVESSLGGTILPITTDYVLPPNPCLDSGPYLELSVKRRADTIKFHLTSTQPSSGTSSDAALSEIEIFIDESHVHSRYEHRELDSARTWIEPAGTSFHQFDEVYILGGAHLAFMPLDYNLTEPVSVQVGQLYGDTTGYIHLGFKQSMSINITHPDISFNTRVYEEGRLVMPSRAFFKGVELISSGNVAGIDDLFVFDGGFVHLDANGSLGYDSDPREHTLSSLHVQDGGTFWLESIDVCDRVSLSAYNITVYGGGHFQSNAGLNISASHLFAIYSGGELNLDRSGFQTRSSIQLGSTLVRGPGQGYGGVSGGSGGGHGGSGGRGSGQSLVGLAYGSIYDPTDCGSAGGYGEHYGELYFGSEPTKNTVQLRGIGGRGGGALKVTSRHVIIDGIISANGEPSLYARAGGGSGGSVWVECEELDGFGTISVDGGNGQLEGGGGAGGRVAINYQNMVNFNGTFTATGGSSSKEDGGAGTVYLERHELLSNTSRQVTHKILKVNNRGRSEPRSLDGSQEPLRNLLDGLYDDITEAGGITWLWHTDNEYGFDEIHLHGNAHVAVLSNTSGETITVVGGELYGDRSAVIHIGKNQYLHFNFTDVYFATNVLLYRYGELTVPPRLSMRDVWMDIKGTFNGIDQFTVDEGGQLTMWSVGRSTGQPVGVYECVNMTVRSEGNVKMLAVEGDDDITFQTTYLIIQAGGIVETNRLIITAENITIDSSGSFNADHRGHPAGEGPGAGLPRSAFPGVQGGSGAGHGGRGGRSYGGIYSAWSYGSTHMPRQMGSGGGPGGSGGKGAGSMWLLVNDTLRVEGLLHANGEDGYARSGGGSGGSLLLDVFHLDGSGIIEVRGGSASNGGAGSGGRGAIYYQHSSFTGDYLMQGGMASEQNGAAGTFYLQQNTTDGITVYRHLVADNDQQSSTSMVVEEESLTLRGSFSYGSLSYTSYSGVIVETSHSPYKQSSSSSHSYNALSNMFNPVSGAYVTHTTAPVIVTITLPFTVYVKAIKINPVCSGWGYGTQFRIVAYSETEADVADVTNGFVSTLGCSGIYQGFYHVRKDVIRFEIHLQGNAGFASLRNVEILSTENPLATEQSRYSAHPETLIVTSSEESSSLHYDKITVKGGAKLGITGNSSSLSLRESLTGDHTGQITIRTGQSLDVQIPRNFLTISLLAKVNSSITLSEVVECRRIGMKIYGELHRLDRLTIGDQCRVSMENPTFTRLEIDHLDIKTFGSLDINNENDGHTTILGTKLDVRSGAQMMCGDLKIDYDDISFEPSSLLQVGFSPNYEHHPYDGIGLGLSGASGSSGAGHGSNGGQGRSRPIAGASYGSFMTPNTFGSVGGHSVFPHRGGSPGGRLFLSANRSLHIDGTLDVSGGAGTSPNAGGGSGGSIWIETETFNGDGSINALGGDGEGSGGGGGAGGRGAVYFTYNHFSGSFVAAGGVSSYEPGGPGTVYLHKLQPVNGTSFLDASSPEGQIMHDSNVSSPLTNRTLYLNNLGRLPRSKNRNLTELYSEYQSATTITWLEPSVPAKIAIQRNNQSHNYSDDFVIDELHVYGGAEVAFIDPLHPGSQLMMRLGTIGGDRTGRMLIGFNQTMEVIQPDFPLSVDVYRGGEIVLYGELIVSGVTFNIEGILPYAENITIRDGGVLNMHEMIGLDGEATETVLFNSINIRNHGTFLTHNGKNRRALIGDYLQVYGGASLLSTNLYLEVRTVIVDSYGTISVLGSTKESAEGPGGAFMNSGASHGGEGGGENSLVPVPQAYGSFTTPTEFGSSSSSGTNGGGILSVLISDLRVEGRLEANGMNSGDFGGASGGSIMIQAETIHGTGVISANGGAGTCGGGGGRMALYYKHLSDGVNHEVRGGQGSLYEHGASGTVYLKEEGDVERKILKSYNHFARASSQVRRTVVPLPPDPDLDHDLDLLDMGQYAHVELEAVDIHGDPATDDSRRTLHTSDIAGDLLGVLHVGENDSIEIGANATSRIPFSITVYQDGRVSLPPKSVFQGVDLTMLGGRLERVDLLEIAKHSRFTFDPSASINSEQPSDIDLASLLLLGGGTMEYMGSPAGDDEMKMSLEEELEIRGGGVMRGNHLSITAHDIMIDSGALMDVSRRGWPPGEGPAPGIYGVKGAAGASHGGRGGKGTSVDHSDNAYGNVTNPNDYGSGGSLLTGAGQTSSGGGIIKLMATGNVLLDGEILASGGDANHVRTSGASGGSIFISGGAVTGRGRILSDGGDATCVPHCSSCDPERRCLQCTDYKYWIDFNCVDDCRYWYNRRWRGDRDGRHCNGETDGGIKEIGGGGSGGRIAIHAKDDYKFRGTLQAHGGSSHLEPGAGSTIYTSLVSSNITQRSLIVDNFNREPTAEFLPDDLDLDSSRTYVFVGDKDLDVERLQIERGAHVVFATSAEGEGRFTCGLVEGDGTGLVHILPETPVHILDSVSPFPVAFRNYEGSTMELPKAVYLGDLSHKKIYVEGSVEGLEDFIVGERIEVVLGTKVCINYSLI